MSIDEVIRCRFGAMIFGLSTRHATSFKTPGIMNCYPRCPMSLAIAKQLQYPEVKICDFARRSLFHALFVFSRPRMLRQKSSRNIYGGFGPRQCIGGSFWARITLYGYSVRCLSLERISTRICAVKSSYPRQRKLREIRRND